jgi:hypothetical protein
MMPKSERKTPASRNGSSIDGANTSTRKHYEPPKVECYGDARAVTKAVGSTGAMDAKMGSSKTAV